MEQPRTKPTYSAGSNALTGKVPGLLPIDHWIGSRNYPSLSWGCLVPEPTWVDVTAGQKD
jgi:hypothetical protein